MSNDNTYWDRTTDEAIDKYLSTKEEDIFNNLIYPALYRNAEYWINKYGVQGVREDLTQEVVTDAYVNILPKIKRRDEGYFSFFNVGIKNLVFNKYIAKSYTRKKSGCTYSEDLLAPEDFLKMEMAEYPSVRSSTFRFFLKPDGVGKKRKYKKFVDANKDEIEKIINSVDISISYNISTASITEYRGRHQIYDALIERFAIDAILCKYILSRVGVEIVDIIDNQ